MKPTILLMLLLCSLQTQANSFASRASSNFLEASVNCIHTYLAGKSAAFRNNSLPTYTSDSKKFLDTATGEYWLLVKADSSPLNQSESWLSSRTTASIIAYGLFGSLLLTLLILGVGLREMTREP